MSVPMSIKPTPIDTQLVPFFGYIERDIDESDENYESEINALADIIEANGNTIVITKSSVVLIYSLVELSSEYFIIDLVFIPDEFADIPRDGLVIRGNLPSDQFAVKQTRDEFITQIKNNLKDRAVAMLQVPSAKALSEDV